MKAFGNILAYLGIVLLVAATYFSFKYALAFITAPGGVWTNPPWENWAPYQYMLGAVAAGITGTLFASFGVLIAQLQKMWVILLIVGISYCLPTITWLVYPSLKGQNEFTNIGAFIVVLIFLLPGIACIIEGLLIRKPRAQLKQ